MLKKQNVEDVLIVRISFIIDKSNVNENRNMFLSDKSSSDSKDTIVIEEIVMIGYLSNIDSGVETDFRANFYKFSDIENDGIMRDSEIMRQLDQKNKERLMETQQFTAGLDFEERQRKKDITKLKNYTSYKATRTIFDDMTKPKNFE